jgi:hypothetical protein
LLRLDVTGQHTYKNPERKHSLVPGKDFVEASKNINFYSIIELNDVRRYLFCHVFGLFQRREVVVFRLHNFNVRTPTACWGDFSLLPGKFIKLQKMPRYGKLFDFITFNFKYYFYFHFGCKYRIHFYLMVPTTSAEPAPNMATQITSKMIPFT